MTSVKGHCRGKYNRTIPKTYKKKKKKSK